MKIKNLAVVLLLLFIAIAPTRAERLFILFDPSCMDRLDYDLVRPEGKADYITYHVNIQSGEKLILEVGPESSNEQNYLPPQYLTCSTGGFDEALMRRINANIDEVYVVYEQGNNRYTVSPVTLAAYYLKQGPVVTYNSPKYRLRFNLENGVIGENLAMDNPGVKLYFEGREDNGCQGAYLFRQLAPQSAYPVMDLKLVPEIGIIEERSGATATTSGAALIVEDINRVKLDRYLRDYCGVEPGSRGNLMSVTAAGRPAEYGNTNPNPGLLLPPGATMRGGNAPATAAAPATMTPAAAAPAPAAESAVTMHTVQKGETLYGISRRYNVSVPDIQEWNNMNGTTIRVGQQLRIRSNQSDLAAKGPAATGTVAQPAQPAPTTGPAPAPAAGTAVEHIVKPGETVASLALRYGYTEDRFRLMNDLGPNDFIKIGQRLRTTDCVCPPAGAQPAGTTGLIRPESASPGVITPVPYETAPAGAMRPQPQNTPPAGMSSRGVPVPAAAANQPTYPTTTYPSTTYPRTDYPATQARGGTVSPQSYDYPPAGISNDPSFGSVIPQAYDYAPAEQEASRSMSRLESQPTIGARNTPASSGRALPATRDYQYTGQPQSYDAGSAYPTAPPANRRVHIVQEGENLTTIARRYNIAIERLQQLNGLAPGEIIIPYQRLYIE